MRFRRGLAGLLILPFVFACGGAMASGGHVKQASGPTAEPSVPDPGDSDCRFNGDFELHAATQDQVNLTNPELTRILDHGTAFFVPAGTGHAPGAIDLMTSGQFGGITAQSGNWFVGMTPHGSDAIALELCGELVANQRYAVSFWVSTWGRYTAAPVVVGVSTEPTEVGRLLYTSPATSVRGRWVRYSFTFIADDAGFRYLTITTPPGGGSRLWTHVDNFTVVRTVDGNE